MRLLCCIGLITLLMSCSPKKKPVSPPVSYEKMLNKVTLLSNWEYEKSAEDWYKAFTSAKYPRKVRMQAFLELEKLYSRQKNYEKWEENCETAVTALPKLAHQLYPKLWSHYRTYWQWKKLAQLLEKSAKHSGLEFERQKEWQNNFASWNNRPLVLSENFLSNQFFQKSRFTHPTFFNHEKTRCEMKFRTLTCTNHKAGQNYNWDGSSFVLKFDIAVHTMEWTGNIHIGIQKEDDTSKGLWVSFSCGGGTGDLHYGLSFRGIRSHLNTLKPISLYQPGIWYHMVIDYRKEIQQARLAVYERDSQKFLGERITQVTNFSAGRYFLGILPTISNGHFPRTAEGSLDDIQLLGNGWQIIQHKPDVMNLAHSQPRKVIDYFSRQVRKKTQDYRSLEFLAYLWQKQGNHDKFLEYLRKRVKVMPKDALGQYFQVILERNK